MQANSNYFKIVSQKTSYKQDQSKSKDKKHWKEEQRKQQKKNWNS